MISSAYRWVLGLRYKFSVAINRGDIFLNVLPILVRVQLKVAKSDAHGCDGGGCGAVIR